ncbi:PhnD/SsuA/transferrin family substrate-binding protein [Rhizobium laguerreae]|uniref:substrate-binding domain-containing protein n=1 Tax=Rhizobium laguerreae TaxID=1076926 RepID=UPI001C91438D|nr:PhnD/SsuA/transferrin family substrate-binding protein [Rhizobium laguerreae]MBY3246142.1 PhnD/SsuA/transferrin family substrate-binding protein [Rhizobium laguerreae]MBY3252779.1 PhnD/SsuA/transferrin family substrate-binding protein [Rhizobium laguerreae]
MASDDDDHCRCTDGRGITRRSAILGAAGASFLRALPASSTEAGFEASPGVIRFGLTPVFLSNDLEVIDELQAYLTKATGQAVQLVTQRTYQEVTALLVSGALEAAWICGYPYMKYKNELSLVATPVWRGQPLYQSYVIVSADRAAADFDDLKGDLHAFSDPDSNSGYLVTKTYLSRRHTSEAEFFKNSFFTYGHRNVIRAVASGLADSGSVDGYVWEVMRELEPDLIDRTRVLVRSAWNGFPPIAAPARIEGSAAFTRIRKALTEMADDPQGRSVLQRLRLDAFAKEPPGLYAGIQASMDILRRFG